jgi:DNA-binding XRE family transcriptional regulator
MATMLSEDLEMIKPRIKVVVAEYEVRSNRKVEYREIADSVGVSQQQFSSWVNGRSWPRMDKAFKLAALLGCKVDDLYSYEGE